MSLNNQIESVINEVLEPLISQHKSIIVPNHIADLVNTKIDPDDNSPELKTYSSMMHLRAKVRSLLAHNFDPVQKAKDYIENNQDDLFDGVLQDYYPVQRQDEENNNVRCYALRDELTEDDVEKICSRMEKSGNSIIEHAQKLRGYYRKLQKTA